jgi:hypothetical protein
MTKKNGKVKGVQLYKCATGGKQFLGGERLDNLGLYLSWRTAYLERRRNGYVGGG